MTSTDLPAPGCGEALGAGSPIFEVTVYGTPAPQGSKRHVGRGIMVESSAKVKPWREAVKHAITSYAPPLLLEGPLAVVVSFVLPKPKTAKKGALPGKRPDLDKLLRSTFDGLGEAGVWKDDAQVVHVDALKRYVEPGEVPCAAISVVAA